MELHLRFVILTVLLGLVTEVTSQGDEDDCDMSMPYSKNKPCPRNLLPVCGTDSNTYHNLCLFCQAKRKRVSEGQTRMTKSHDGSCDDGGKRPVPNQANPNQGPEKHLTGGDLNIENVLAYYRRVLEDRKRAAQGSRSSSQRSQGSQWSRPSQRSNSSQRSRTSQRSQGSQRSSGSQRSQWSRTSQRSQRSRTSQRSQGSQRSSNSRRSQNYRRSSPSSRSSRTSSNENQRRRSWS